MVRLAVPLSSGLCCFWKKLVVVCIVLCIRSLVAFKVLFIFGFHGFDLNVPNVQFSLFLTYLGLVEHFEYVDWVI